MAIFGQQPFMGEVLVASLQRQRWPNGRRQWPPLAGALGLDQQKQAEQAFKKAREPGYTG